MAVNYPALKDGACREYPANEYLRINDMIDDKPSMLKRAHTLIDRAKGLLKEAYESHLKQAEIDRQKKTNRYKTYDRDE
jgi:hypothetical protein